MIQCLARLWVKSHQTRNKSTNNGYRQRIRLVNGVCISWIDAIGNLAYFESLKRNMFQAHLKVEINYIKRFFKDISLGNLG